MLINEIIEELKNTSSTNKKIEILKTCKNNTGFKKILLWTYDKINTNYFVKKIPSYTEYGDLSLDTSMGLDILDSMLIKLSTRKVTGNAALNLVQETLEQFELLDQEIIENILGRDLKCGVSTSSINKAIPKLIPVFDVVLAKNYKDHFKKVENGSWKISAKIDGCRNITIKKNGKFKFYSRQGKDFYTLTNLIPELEKQTKGIDSCIFDGEICLVDDTGKEDFQGIMKQIKKKNHTILNPKYKIFDMLTEDEFYSGKGDASFNERYIKLRELITDCHKLDVLEQVDYTEDSFAEMQRKAEEGSWEGLILRRSDVGYKSRRTDHLLKVKKFFDAEFIVKDIKVGDFQYTVSGIGQTSEVMLTAVKILLDDKWEVSVGSGFSIEQRKYLMEHPEDIIGKTITVNYFERTKNKNGGESLRFPTLKHIYESKRNV